VRVREGGGGWGEERREGARSVAARTERPVAGRINA